MLRKLLLYIILLSCAGKLPAQDTAVFTVVQNEPLQPLRDFLQVSMDKHDSMNIEVLMNEKSAAFFKPLSAIKDPKLPGPYWLRLNILPSFSSDSFYIGLPHKNRAGISQGNDRADVWVIENGKIIHHYKTGNLDPVSVRPVASPINHNLFPVSLRQGIPVTVYWKLQRIINFEPLQFDFALQHTSLAHVKINSFDKLAWFYTGIMFIMFIFGLVFFIITRAKPFIWFTAIAAVLCMHMQLLNPESYMTGWLFPEHPGYQFHLFTLLTGSLGIIVLQFARSFANTRTLLPRWDKLMLAVMGYTGLMAIAGLILLELDPGSFILFPLTLLAFLLTMACAIKLMTTKALYARWAGFALLWLYFFQVCGILWNADLLPSWFPNPWALAQIGMIVILFFALAYQFKQSAKERAEAAKVIEMDSIRTRFFANISHEFRTPLTLMLGPMKQLEENDLGKDQQEKYLRMMRRNGDRLLQLINQLLDLSKLESGKMQLQVAKTDISALSRSIAHSFESLAEQNQVNYHMHFPEENMIGYVDRDKLEKILVNLLANAFRFTPAHGSVSLLVETAENRVRFTIDDDGTGMSKQQLEKIFDRFHQVTGTEGGTGIGLSLVKELLNLHHGQVSVKSEMGKGSSFRVSIPITKEFYTEKEFGEPGFTDTYSISSSAPEQQAEQDEVMENDPSLPLVLIVEDNIDLQQFISDTLRPYFQIQVAANGKAALAMAIEIVPDCIVSDVMMPEMDGIEFCNRARKEPATSHIPFILLTAKASMQSRIEGLQEGADDYLVKPFEGKELIIRIQNLIEQRKLLREKYSRQVLMLKPENIKTPSLDQQFIQQVRNQIEINLDKELFGVSELAASVHLSRSQLHRKLRSLTGQAPNELIRNFRLEKAFQLLENQSGNITEIAYQTGFSSQAYFSKCFSDKYGYGPSELKKRNL